MAIRPKLNRVWTSSSATLRRDPGDAKYLQGWISEIPTFQVLNYLQWKVDTTILAIAERGAAEWGTDVQYVKGSIAWDELDGTIYVATVAAPSRTLPPSQNSAHWTRSSIQISREEYVNIAAAIAAHIADTTGNPHHLTADRLGAYNKAEIDALVTTYHNLVLSHANDTNNPHQLTALLIGAVPTTGGTYTGDVQFNTNVFFDAGKTTKISNGSGLFLQNGNNLVGIDSSGNAVAGDTTTTSKLVDELSFPVLKATNEADYATPSPTFQMPLASDINIVLGSGLVDSGAWEPNFSMLDRLTATNGQNTYGFGSANNVADPTKPTTIAIDVMSNTQRVPTDVAASVRIGVTSIGISFSGGSVISAETAGQTSPTHQVTGPINTWYRVVCVWEGTFVRIYLNGAYVSGRAIAAQTATDGKLQFSILGRQPADARVWGFRNLRIWNEALSAKQVSTL
ncbi:putative tail fiber protein [Pectobacterium phage PP101]|uniref:Putative tail fiber protein n=1 Tax=Pectobacterium phage PP101 TaxID=1916414 RepID=A0A1J0MEW9_9CAUD|nr:tail fiber protein [Pectobacterium phage PP101]APD19731.1 putative tail fiber protein [Pectobacterium phage PP101]